MDIRVDIHRFFMLWIVDSGKHFFESLDAAE